MVSKIANKSTANSTKSKLSSMEIVVEEIQTRLESGSIAPGQRLITSEIASKLGISLAPVREAFHLLAGEGLLELLPNRGARVRELSSDDLVDGIEMLQVVGGLALRLLSKRTLTAKQTKNLRAIFRRIYSAGETKNARRFFRAISDSHRFVNEYAGNRYLNPVINRLHLEYFNLQLSRLVPNHWDQWVSNYRQFDEAIRNGEIAKLEKMWVRHTTWVIELIEKEQATAP